MGLERSWLTVTQAQTGTSLLPVGSTRFWHFHQTSHCKDDDFRSMLEKFTKSALHVIADSTRARIGDVERLAHRPSRLGSSAMSCLLISQSAGRFKRRGDTIVEDSLPCGNGRSGSPGHEALARVRSLKSCVSFKMLLRARGAATCTLGGSESHHQPALNKTND